MRNPQKFGIQEILSLFVLFIKFVFTMKIDEILFSFECHLSNTAKSMINKKYPICVKWVWPEKKQIFSLYGLIVKISNISEG